jgi:heme-degrading monooxygenase HmoA
MIVREWRGVTSSSKSEAYTEYLSATGVKECLATPGIRGVFVLRRAQPDDTTEFVFVSLWDSMDAIRQFAGQEVERAVYYPEDREFLLNMDPNVAHYELVRWEQPRPVSQVATAAP